MDSTIAFRLSKTGQSLVKSESYQIRINGNLVGQIDNEKNALSEQLPMGKYSIEVCENNFFIRKDIVLAIGQMQIITINPSITFTFSRGLLIGIAIVTTGIIGYMAYENEILPQLLPLMFIPFIPLLVFRKKHYGENFALTISRISL